MLSIFVKLVIHHILSMPMVLYPFVSWLTYPLFWFHGQIKWAKSTNSSLWNPRLFIDYADSIATFSRGFLNCGGTPNHPTWDHSIETSGFLVSPILGNLPKKKSLNSVRWGPAPAPEVGSRVVVRSMWKIYPPCGDHFPRLTSHAEKLVIEVVFVGSSWIIPRFLKVVNKINVNNPNYYSGFHNP